LHGRHKLKLELQQSRQQIGGTMASDSSTVPLRLFVAIVLPEPVRDEIIRVQQELQPLVPRAVARWTKPDQFHLTLRFLGDVSADGVEDLKKSVGAVCRNVWPLSLRAEGVGFFPNPRSPRVIWVGINDREGRLVDLQQQIETAVGPFSSEPGEKNFTGHVTLSRLKNPRPADTQDLAARAQSLEKRLFGEWTANEIGIILSELSPVGARHTSLAAFRLGVV
jgi:2'-5' RNA ligase